VRGLAPNARLPRLGGILVFGSFVLAASAGALASSPADDDPAGEPGCRETQRWPVKVLADPAATRVRFAPVPATVEGLRRLPRPKRVTDGTRRLPPHEFSTFRVQASLVAARRNSRTDDIEVVIRGKDAPTTLVVVFPDERCPTFATSEKAEDMHTAEHQFTGPCGTTLDVDIWTTLRGTATVTGVGFFAVKRSSNYSAPNGFELHPALEFHSKRCTRP
jgi:hypothetical protein